MQPPKGHSVTMWMSTTQRLHQGPHARIQYIPENKNRAMHPDIHVYILTHTQSQGISALLIPPGMFFTARGLS